MLENRPDRPDTLDDASSREFHQLPAALGLGALRASVGIAAVVLLALGLRPGWLASLVLAAVGAMFIVYFLRRVIDQLSTVRLGRDGVSVVGPMPRSIDFDRLDDVTLRYFSTRRDGENGWMQLVLRSGRVRLSLDSDHPAFLAVAQTALAHARRKGLRLSAATLANSRALGSFPAFDGTK